MRRLSTDFAWLILSAVAVVVALPVNSHADSIPAAIFEVEAIGGITISTAGTVSGTAFNGGSEGGTASDTATASYGGGDASVSASGSTVGGVATANSAGQGMVTYFLMVARIAGSGSELVPLIFTGSGTTSASGPFTTAYAYFETPGGQLYACSASGSAVGTCGTLPSSNSGSIDYSVSSNTLYDVQVIASGSSGLGSGTWSASVDPQVEINPSFADANDFTLEFSPGAPSAITPEPSSTLMLGTGLLALLGTANYKKLVK
jgi:hypothetical protein